MPLGPSAPRRAADIAGAGIELEYDKHVFTGKQLTPAVVSVKLGGQTLTATNDYTVSYGENVDTGTGVVTITGAGKYAGTANATFAITKADLADTTITADLLAEQPWTGSAVKPITNGSVKLGEGEDAYTLVEGTDYAIVYMNSVNTGTAMAILAGKGNFEGLVAASFEIGKPVARTNDGKGFASLRAAVNYANATEGVDTVELLQDNSDSQRISVTKPMTIDLGGHTWDMGEADDEAQPGATVSGNEVTVVNGTVLFKQEEGADASAAAFLVADDAVLTLGEGLTLDVTDEGASAVVAIELAGLAEVDIDGAEVLADGTAIAAPQGGFVGISGGSVESGADAVVGSGMSLLLTGGSVSATGTALAIGKNSFVGVTDGLAEGGESALVAGAGSAVYVTGGDLSGEACGIELDGAWLRLSDDAYVYGGEGPAILVDSADADGPAAAEIVGGTLETDGAAPAVLLVQGSAQAEVSGGQLFGRDDATAGIVASGQAKVSVSYAEVAAGAGAKAVATEGDEAELVVSGGWFSAPVADGLVAGGLWATTEPDEDAPLDDAPYTVLPAEEVALPTAVARTYNGQEQAGVAIGSQDPVEFVDGGAYQHAATDAGRYVAKVKLSDAKRYVWADGTNGEQTLEWSIAPRSVADLPIEAIAPQAYTGRAIEPGVTICNPDIVAGTDIETGDDVYYTLVEGAGKDYTVAYDFNTNVGVAKATITGQGNYGGSTATYFGINEKDSTNVVVAPIESYLHDGTAYEPALVVYDTDHVLTEDEIGAGVEGFQPEDDENTYKLLEAGKDYTVKYEHNVEVGTATAIVGLIGNYEGILTQNFQIEGVGFGAAEGRTDTNEVSGNDSSFVNVSFSDMTLPIVEPDPSIGRTIEAAWPHTVIIAPEHVDDAWLATHEVSFRFGNQEPMSFNESNDGKLGGDTDYADRLCMNTWTPITPAMVRAMLASGLMDMSVAIEFDWDGDGTYEQLYNIQTIFENLTLTDTDGNTVLQVEDGTIVYPHDLTHFEAVDPAIDEAGNLEYWYCEDCDEYFVEDENGEKVVADFFDDIYIPALMDLSEGTVTIRPTSVVYNGADQKPTHDQIEVACNGELLIEGVDFELTLPEEGEPWVNAGEYPVQVTGKGRFAGELEGTFAIDRLDMTGLGDADVLFDEDGRVSGVSLGDVDGDGTPDLLDPSNYDVAYTVDPETENAAVLVTGKDNADGVKYVLVDHVDTDKLADAIAEAKALADDLLTSDDDATDAETGHALANGDEYLNSEEAKALADAIEAAEAALDDALNPETDTTQKDVNDALKALQDAIDAAEEAKKTFANESIDDAKLEVAEQRFRGEGVDPVAKGDVELTAADGTVIDPAGYDVTYAAGDDGAALDEAGLPKEPGTYTATATGKAPEYTGSTQATFEVVDRWERIWGQNGYDTMRAIVETEGVFEPDTTDTVVIASRATWQDPLAATALAGVYGAPLLLVGAAKDSLPAQTKNELQRLRPSRVIVVGNTKQVPASTFDAIKAASGSGNVIRIAGDDAEARANNIMTKTSSWGTTAVIATQNSFRDTLSMAPVAYKQKFPILFVGQRVSSSEGGKLSSATLKALKDKGINNVIIAGGNVAVSGAVEGQLRGIGVSSVRWFGQDALDTSATIAQNAMEQYGMTIDHASVARSDGNNYVDALAGAALTGKLNSVLVLANSKTDLASGAKAFDAIAQKIKGNLVHGHVYGGTVAMSEDFYQYFRKTQ